MINQSKENETYITGVEEKNEEEKSIQYSTKNSPNKYIKRNYKPIEHSDSKKNENIISIVFPSIKPHNTNKISNLLISSEKYIKIKQDMDEEKNSKSQKIYQLQSPTCEIKQKIYIMIIAHIKILIVFKTIQKIIFL